MIAFFLPAIQYFRSLTSRDWRLFTKFLISFGALCWAATELHWHAAFKPYTLSVANQGKLIGASGTIGESGFRNKFYLFDDNLNLVKSVRLHNLGSCGQHALSNDGKFILTVVGIPYIGFNSLGGELEQSLELISLDGTTPFVRYVIPPYITSSSAISCGFYRYPFKAGPIRLIGTPPTFAQVAGKDIGLIDLSAMSKVVGAAGPFVSSNVSAAGDYVVATDHTDPFTRHSSYQLVCCSIGLDGVKEEFRELQSWKLPTDIKPTVIENGRLAIQEDDFVRIVDLNQNEKSLRESKLSWKKASGELKAISESGNTLLFEKPQTELFAVSSSTASVVGHWQASAPSQICPEFLINDDRAVFAQVNTHSQDTILTSWNWHDSTVRTKPFASLSNSAKQTLFGIYLAGVGMWGFCLFMFAINKRSLLLGTAAVAGLVCLLLLYYQLHARAEYFESYEFDSVSIILFSLWQIVLSLAYIWAFRYFNLAIASAATLILTICAICIVHQFTVHTNYYVGVFAVFGIGYAIVQSIIGSKVLQNRQLSILGCCVLMTVIAILIQLYLWSGLSNFIATWVRDDFRFVFQPYSNWQTASIAVGLAQVLGTLLVLRVAKSNAPWTFVVQVCLLAILIIAATVFQKYLTEAYPVAIVGMLITTGISAVTTWFLLNLVDRFFEPQNQIARSYAPANATSSFA